MLAARRVVIALFDGVEVLDVTGPASVFSAASRLAGPGRRGYAVELVAARPAAVGTSSGVRLVADRVFDEVDGAIDTLLVPGGLDPGRSRPRPVIVPEVVDWVRRTAPGARRTASVCAGAHVLAAAGLLDGRRVTTHWCTAAQLAEDHPAVDVDPDPIFVHDGRIWTCAGVTAGMDLALAMVADDLGEQLARTTARWLVMYLKRPGGQSQFSVPLSTPAPRHDGIRELQAWIGANLGADLSVQALARQAHMSERHFARVFTAQAATTPAAFVDASRVEAARRLLEESDEPVESIAARCGFGSVETLYRSFRRRTGTSPVDYRRRFRTS